MYVAQLGERHWRQVEVGTQAVECRTEIRRGVGEGAVEIEEYGA